MKKTIRGDLKKRLLSGETVVGPFVIVPSMTLVETLGYSGMDFCILDTEHGPLSIETVNELVISAQGSGVAPIIRIPNPGPGNGCLSTISAGKPMALPIFLTSSLKSMRNGSNSLSCIRSGKPPTL